MIGLIFSLFHQFSVLYFYRRCQTKSCQSGKRSVPWPPVFKTCTWLWPVLLVSLDTGAATLGVEVSETVEPWESIVVSRMRKTGFLDVLLLGKLRRIKHSRDTEEMSKRKLFGNEETHSSFMEKIKLFNPGDWVIFIKFRNLDHDEKSSVNELIFIFIYENAN